MVPEPFALIRLATTLLVCFSISVLYWIPLRAGGRMRWIATLPAALLLIVAPLAIPAENIRLRALAAVVVVDQLGKLFDAARRSREYHADPAGFQNYLRFLIPFPVLLVTGEARRASGPVRTPLPVAGLRALTGTLIFAASWPLLLFLATSEMLRANFVLDHLLKTALFVPVMSSLSTAVVGWERLAGYETLPPMNQFWRSRTPADFWLRYNTRVQAWFARNIYLPAGGLRHPVRGVVLVFLVSAIIHEVLFDIATSQIDGSQLAFFLLQIPAVLLSPRLDRLARSGGISAKIFAHAATITWLVATSALFFRGVERVFPMLYAS